MSTQKKRTKNDYWVVQTRDVLHKGPENPDVAAALRSVADGAFGFSKQFYKAIVKNTSSNIITSPICASNVLSMLAYGARGDTQTTLETGLHFNKDCNLQRIGLKSLIESLNKTAGIELKQANKLFVASTVNVKPEYQELAKEVFDSAVEKLDFSNVEHVCQRINNFCEQMTASKIKDVVSPGNFNPETDVVLVNAVYFKARWDRQFYKEYTHKSLFHLEDGTTQYLQTMHTYEFFTYGVLKDLKAKFIQLPYQGYEVSMYIILPDEVDGLKNFQQNFVELNLDHLLHGGSGFLVDLDLPKFEIETTIDLHQPLTELGMGNVFKDSADFCGMVDGPSVITKAIQKAYIKVDEFGTEASACALMLRGGGDPQKRVFRANRPFYYAIIKKLNGSETGGIVLFQGHFKGNI